MRILFISRWFPYPVNNGSKIRIFNLLKGLSEGNKVTLISFYDPSFGTPDKTRLMSYCEEIYTVPWQGFQSSSWKARLGYFSSKPRSVIDTFSEEMKKQIEEAVAATQYDLAILSQVDMAAYVDLIHGVPAIFEEVEVGTYYSQYFLAKKSLKRVLRGLTWYKYRVYLAALIKKFALCTAVSQKEAQLITHYVYEAAKVEILPNFVDLTVFKSVQERPQPNRIVFTGSFTYSPNYEAMLWFLGKVYPEIQARVPGIEMTITGDHANLPIPATDHVALTGLVDNVYPHIAGSWCSVVPLQIGGGTRLKILEAMALHTPVVTTSVGAEGLEVQDGKHLLIADEPAAFAQAVIRLFSEPDFRQSIANEAYKLVQERYNREVVIPKFLSLIHQIA